jgi:hypothetical protein
MKKKPINKDNIKTWNPELVEKIFDILISESSQIMIEALKAKHVSIEQKRKYLINAEKKFAKSFK